MLFLAIINSLSYNRISNLREKWGIHMKREDLRKNIIPVTLYNTNYDGEIKRGELDTKDYLYIPAQKDYIDMNEDDVRKAGYSRSALIQDITEGKYQAKSSESTDFLDSYLEKTIKGKQCHEYYLRSVSNGLIRKATTSGYTESALKNEKSHVGVRVSLYYEIPEKTEELSIRTVRDRFGKIRYHTLQIGEYSGAEVVGKGVEFLEKLYNHGDVKEGLKATGRWYSSNGLDQDIWDERGYQGKHSPEFECNGVRFVRTMTDPATNPNQYTEGSTELKQGRVRWQRVDPVSFIILNWDSLPTDINPDGFGTQKYFKLISEDILISNMPFYPKTSDKNSELWQNSTIRGFLNGIDVRNITENGNPEYGASNGGDFRGECNFLNETFNLSREPIVEYTIPESEEAIPDDAFNGCITLEKLNLHNGIESIGKRAFDGIDFRYAYKTPTGEIMFSKELLKDIDESAKVIEIEKLRKALPGLDYNIFLKDNQMDDIIKLSETLIKHHFSIPYIYGMKLLENGLASLFCEKSVFKFFKKENPNITEILSEYPEEERLDFFKFATALGCFSKEKILDENGNETQTIVAQKASSALASMLKKNANMALR